jgi:hypothetical protein
MHEIDDIDSILKAFNEISLKPKKKVPSSKEFKNFIPKLNKDLVIPVDVDTIIREAEEYKKKSPLILTSSSLIQDEDNSTKTQTLDKSYEEIQIQIIDDLYSKLSKKFKKNTLKTIFDLRLKIKDLEKNLKNFQSKKNLSIDKKEIINNNISTSDINNKDILRNEVVTSLQIQNASIEIQNQKIINYKEKEEKLRFQIINLEQDKTLLLNKLKKFDQLKNYSQNINDTKEILKSIYKQVENQKKIFIDLSKNSIKNRQESIFFKENYEKLIIENNDIKKKLSNTKQQVEAFEEIKKELALTFQNFNNVLSKNSIIKLNESFSKINSDPVVSENIIKKIK